MKKTIYLLALGLLTTVVGCKDEETPSLGDPPTAADAEFTYQASTSSDNVIEFTATNPNITAKWDLGNGVSAEGTNVTGTYPAAGTYKVTLTVFNSGGSTSNSMDVVIAQDDPTLLDNPLYNILTGGAAGQGYKIWVIDSTRSAHFGVGPNPSGAAGDYPEWYAAGKLDKAGSGMYDDQFKFTLKGFRFDQTTNGKAYVNAQQKDNFPDAVEIAGDWNVTFPNQEDETWNVTVGSEDTTLTVSGQSFIGYYTGVQTYKIVKMSENELFLRFEDAADATLAWYLRLVPEDYPIDDPDPTFKLPFDFETEEPVWTPFGNSTYQYIDNPQSGGINTSARVLETVHGNETWAGIHVTLDTKFDLTGADSMIVFKLYAPTTGIVKVKLENSADGNQFVERDIAVNTANEWVEIKAGFSTEAADLYDKLVLFPGWDVANAGTFYIDDIKQQ